MSTHGIVDIFVCWFFFQVKEAVIQFWDKLPTVNEQYYLGRNEASNQDFLGIVLDYDEENKMVTIT